jgi:hypothetical protein
MLDEDEEDEGVKRPGCSFAEGAPRNDHNNIAVFGDPCETALHH